MLKKITYFFYTVSRGYSLPTSFTSWLVCFVYCLGYGGDFINGIVALIGVTFAHLGANLLDDCIDTIFKVPKQKCKTEYLDKGHFTLKFISIACGIYFLIAAAAGFYLFLQSGVKVLLIAAIAAIIILLYPRLNHYALGEIAVALTYGVLLFSGISVVMTGAATFKLLLLSVPVSLLIMNLLYAHSLMDYDFDSLNCKKTLCVRLGSKKLALKLFLFIGFIAVLIHFVLIMKNILPICAGIIVIPVILYYLRAFSLLKNYIKTTEHKENDFMNIFKLARNASMVYNLLVAAFLIVK